MKSNSKDYSKKDDEISLWSIGTIEMNPFATGDLEKLQDRIISTLKNCEGFVGVCPIIGNGTMFLYNTEENAGEAWKMMKKYDLPVGDGIVECFASKDYMSMFYDEKLQ